MSLRWFHYIFILFAIIGADLAGAMILRSVRETGSVLDFVVWEVEYLSTFFAVEFFFRGYLLFGLRRYLGSLSLFVSMVPYCLIHVLKPAPEAIGSIVAGLLLGTLALCTGSLWSGVLLHVSVALSMDVLASWQSGRLPHF